MATMASVYTIQVNAKPEDAFAYVSDLTKHPEWSGTPLKVEAVSDGPAAEGSEYRSVGRMIGKNFTNDIKVVEYKPSTSSHLLCKPEAPW